MFKKSSKCMEQYCVEVDLTPPPPIARRFVKSTRCESHTCVEVAAGTPVLVRDSKLPDTAPMLAFSPQAWTSFTRSLEA